MNNRVAKKIRRMSADKSASRRLKKVYSLKSKGEYNRRRQQIIDNYNVE